jgi:DNA-binding SARP family transcriptional activator/tetratricopeptide (TPR) repeat protein
MDEVVVRLAGRPSVLRNGAPVPDASIRSRKARRLLTLLAVHRARTVPADQLVEALWGDRPPRRPGPDLATLVSRLRAVLGAHVVDGGREGYRLGGAPAVLVDLDEVARLVTESDRRLAAGEPRLAAAAAHRALELCGTGPILADEPDAGWVVAARAEFDTLLRAARHAGAHACLRAGEVGEAVRIARAAIDVDVLDEPAHRLLMTAHQAAGEPALALAGYERFRAALADELGVDPAPQTREVHLAVLREQRAGPATGVPSRGGPSADRTGRRAELDRLAAAWSAAAAGEPRVLLLAGEGGIGKTWLATQAVDAARATGGLVLSSRCYASERSLFLQPLVDALAGPLAACPAARLQELAGPRAGALAGLMPDLAPALGSAGPERAGSEVERRRAFEAVTLVLRAMAADRPTMLLLDDLHNAGLATVELLHYLARHCAGSRLLVLGTVRVEEGVTTLAALADVAERLGGGPLPAAAVRRLAADAGQAGLAEAIMRRTRGHTLFVVETLRALAAGDTGAPESLQAVVLARLRRAGADTEELLRAGAVLGATVDPATVAGMLGLAPHVAAQRCEQAAAARLLTVSGRAYEFANDLVQEVLYATTPMPTRLAHHRRAADLLTGVPEAVARHCDAAQAWPRAARAWLLAAERALGRFAATDAADLCGHALEAAGRAGVSELAARAHLARGRARVLAASYGDAVADLHAAASMARGAGDRRLEMLALRELGGHGALALGTPVDDCTARLRDGLRIADALGDRGVQADLLGWLTVVATSRLRFDEALSLGLRAAHAGRSAGSEHALAVGLDGLKNAYAYLGEVGPLRGVVEELDPLLRRLGDPVLLQWTVFESAFPAVGAGAWEAAERRIREALEVNRRSGQRVYGSWFEAHLGWLARLQGRFPDAVEHGRRAVAAAASVRHRWMGPAARAMLAVTLLECGEPGRALPLLIDAREQAPADGSEAYLLRCLAPLAEAGGDRAVLDEADALLAGAALPAGSAWLLGADAYLCVARAWLAHGEPARARAVLAPLLAAARRLRWVPALGTGGLVDGLAATALGAGDAPARLTEVAELAGAHGMPAIADRAARALRRGAPGGPVPVAVLPPGRS